MTKNLLIIGGTYSPHRTVLQLQESKLAAFLAKVGGERHLDAGSDEEGAYWFELERAYFPFKKSPILQHRASQDSVTGLAELILEREAKDLGFTSKIVSLDRVLDNRWQLIDKRIFDEVEFVAVSTTYIPAMLVGPILRALRVPERIKLFVGGPGAYKLKDRDLASTPFSYLLKSEAEGRFATLLRHATGDDVDLSSIPGLTFRLGSELRSSSVPRTYVDLDSLPLPDFRTMAREWGGRVIYESTRGCPYRCEFCDYPFLMGNTKFRTKSAETIHRDWTALHAEMGVRDVLCLDSLFTVPPARLLELCDRMVDSGLNQKIRWGCYARPNDLADREFAARMREAGCEYVYVGFESGSQEVLDYMNKKCTVEESARAIENCHQVGLLTFGLFIAGFPGETPEMFESTRTLLKENPPFAISVVPWFPDFADDSSVPIMRPDRIEKFAIRPEHPSTKPVTMWRNSAFRAPLTVPWGSYWTHRGMDLQDAVDLVSGVVEDVYSGRIRAVSEELFYPRTLDDGLTLFQQLGRDRALRFYHGLSRAVLDDRPDSFSELRESVGLQFSPSR
ncbi:MAG: radical SAM protein [Deltaproteobacteria bacterium]|nr:radical SAM protein [Deltaproteobacteria bacterium]